MTNICEHGHLARSCDVCNDDKWKGYLDRWFAWAQTSRPSQVAEKVGAMEDEIKRLRCVCRLASQAITDDIRNAAIDGVAKKKLVLLAKDLANEGSKE